MDRGHEIREATEADFPVLFDLLKAWEPEAQLASAGIFTPTAEATMETVKGMVLADPATVLIAYEDGPVGFLGLVLHDFGVSTGGNFCSENLMFVKRGSKAGKALMAEGMKWAKSKGAKYFTFSPSPLASSRAKVAAKWAPKAGFDPLYMMFWQEI